MRSHPYPRPSRRPVHSLPELAPETEGGVAGASRLAAEFAARNPAQEIGGEGRGGGPEEVPPELGAESEAEEGKVRRGCFQIGLAAPRLCRAWGLLDSGRVPLGPPAGCSPGPIYGSKSRFLAGRRQNSLLPLQREPFKIPEPQRCGQLLLGNVVSWRAPSPALRPQPGTLPQLGTAGRPGPGVGRRSDIFRPVARGEAQASLLIFSPVKRGLYLPVGLG